MGQRRIVSLVPSLTHMVCDFGLRDQLVGCTTFCCAPPGLARTAQVVGGTKDPDLAAIRALAPTHILVNEEENKPEHIEACEQIALTLRTFPKHPGEVPALIRQAGTWLGVGEVAARFAGEAEAALRDLAGVRSALAGRRYLYYIWREPYMVAGADTYISAMLATVGLINAISAMPGASRYPELPVAAAAALAPGPDLVLLSSEPYPFRRRDGDRLRQEWPGAPEILKIDGQLLSWYGTMTTEALRRLRGWATGDVGASAGLVSRPS